MKKSWRKNQFFLHVSCYSKAYCNTPIVQKNRCSRGLGKKLMRDYNEATRVCCLSVESLFRETVIHIFQTIFQIIFPSVLTRLLNFCSQVPVGCKKHSLQYPLSLCFIFPWPLSWVMVCVVQREKNQEFTCCKLHTKYCVLLCVVGCSSGVIHSFYFFLLPKLLLKQEMTVAPRRLNWGDTQMFILHYFSLPWQFL